MATEIGWLDDAAAAAWWADGVSEGRMGMDGESVDARVALPSGENGDLLYRGSIDDAGHLATTCVGGTRRLIERLQADPHLEVRPAQLSDSLRDAEADAELVQYGPVIATGAVGEHTWQLRGRIADDGVWSSVDGGGGGGGALPFQDVGWKKLGHLGSLGVQLCPETRSTTRSATGRR